MIDGRNEFSDENVLSTSSLQAVIRIGNGTLIINCVAITQ
jgi:hypothetical protein